MSSDHHVNIFFESKALDHDTFAVVRFEGEEEISRPYRFVVDLVSDRPDVDLDAVLGRPATLSFQRGDDGELRKIHGVLAEIELGREGQHGHYAYRAVLVPRLWMMSLTRQNQIYQNKTIPEIVEEELKGSKGKGPAGNSTFEFAADDFEFRLIGSYPQKEYLVQYAESDLDFISRLLEHVGIYYFFEQGEDRERIVFCDANVHLPSVPDESSFPYVPPSGTSSSLAESVQFLTARRRQITDKVLLKDYNYRTPQTPLQAEQDVEGEGYGVACHYGDHFKTPEEGQALAKVRAEEVLCGKAFFRGAGDCHGFTAGHLFQLEDHFSDALNQEYLLTAVRHAGSQASSEATGFGEGAEGEATSYRNEFRAIPKTVTYRPARRTAKPKLTGVMSARVDASGPGTRAEIDGEGRYKLVMPFDISGAAEGKATRWVRMAQPYGGGQQGMHFPLLKGTEVLWTCIGGDPDRPVITGVVPNPLNKSVVNAESRTKNRIQTASGILMEFQDGSGPSAQAAASGGGALSGQQQAQRIETTAADLSDTSGSELSSNALMDQQQSTLADPDGLDFVEEASEPGEEDIWLKFKLPPNKNRPFPADYIRYGKPDKGEELERLLIEGSASKAALGEGDDTQGFLVLNAGISPEKGVERTKGTLDYTDDNYTGFVRGDKEEVILGCLREKVFGDEIQVTDGNELGFFDGGRTEFLTGIQGEYSFAGRVDLSAGAEASAAVGAKVEWAVQDIFERVQGRKTEHVKSADLEASDQIKLQVHGGYTGIKGYVSALDIASVAGMAAMTGYYVSVDPNNLSSEEYKEKPVEATNWTIGVGAAMLVASLIDRAVLNASKNDDNPKIEIDKNSIDLEVGSSRIEVTENGIELSFGPSTLVIDANGISVIGPTVTANAKSLLRLSSNTALNVEGKVSTNIGTPAGATTIKGMSISNI